MNYLNGGYVMLDKADSDIFAKASGALQAGKPILWYEDKNTCYFIDTIEKTGSDSIALTKGGLTIVITSGNVVTEKGSVQPKVYTLSLFFSDTTFTINTTDKGIFELNTEYDFVNSDGEYVLSDELTISLISILDKIKVGSYRGIPFTFVGDIGDYINRSSDTQIHIDTAGGVETFKVNLTNKTVNTGNSEDWTIKFTEI